MMAAVTNIDFCYESCLQGFAGLDRAYQVKYFLDRIPQELLNDMMKALPEELSILDGGQISPKIQAATLLRCSEDRKLMVLAGIFFEHQSKVRERSFRAIGIGSSDRNVVINAANAWNQTALELRREAYEFYSQLNGFKVIDSNPSRLSEDCFWYVFKDEPWYPKLDCRTTEETIGSLKNKGYNVSEVPAEGQVVIYSSKGKPEHYGLVVRVEADGTPIIRSKFGDQYVNEHPLELVPYAYGVEAIFLAKNKVDCASN